MVLLESILTTNLQQKWARHWTARKKLFIISYLDNAPDATIHETANKFQIETKQIRDWRNK